MYTYAIKNWANFKTSEIDYEVDEETGDIMIQGNAWNGQPVRFIGIINDVKVVTTKKTNALMAIAQIEDLEGPSKLVIFPRAYENVKDVMKEDGIYKVTGTLSIKPDEAPAIFCDGLEPVSKTIIERVLINVNSGEHGQAILDDIASDLMIQGDNPLYFVYDDMKILIKKRYWVEPRRFANKYSNEQLEIREW